MTQPTQAATAQANTTTVVADTHVHLYNWVDLVPLLDRAAELHLCSGTRTSVLVLTEPASRNTFAKLKKQVDPDGSATLSPDWCLSETAEEVSLAAQHANGAKVFLICGQQIETREGLEVLAIAAGQHIVDGLPISTTLTAIDDAGGYPILPWGVGKWLFNRGRIVSQLIRESGSSASPPFALGDNGGRPRFWSRIQQFTMARELNIPIVSGSDPLPCGSRRFAGASYGSEITCPFDGERPAESLLRAITRQNCDVVPFGEPARSFDFLRDQLALRFNCS